MARPVAHWTDRRLNDLAAVLDRVPAQVTALEVTVKHLDRLITTLEPVPAQVAVLSAELRRLEEENRLLRAELATMERQVLQMAWALSVALVGAGGALVAALV